MKTTKDQRAEWRAEYTSDRCPGCGGALPTHRPIVRGDDVVIRCSWGDTMALLDDLDEAESLLAAERKLREAAEREQSEAGALAGSLVRGALAAQKQAESRAAIGERRGWDEAVRCLRHEGNWRGRDNQYVGDYLERRRDEWLAALASQPADERWGVWCTNGMGAGSWWRDEDGGEAIFASRHAAELAIMHPKNVGGAGWTYEPRLHSQPADERGEEQVKKLTEAEVRSIAARLLDDMCANLMPSRIKTYDEDDIDEVADLVG